MSNPWLPNQPNNSSSPVRLFCFHYAGGAANIFNSWQEPLKGYADIFSVQLPGRWERFREKPFTEMQLLVEAMDGFLASEIQGPYAVVGYSLGALIAFEWIRNQQNKGSSLPLHFFVLSRSGPQIPRIGTPIHQEPDSVFLEKMQQNYGGVPEALLNDPEVREIFLPILKADMAILENYRFERSQALQVPITAIRGMYDQSLSLESLKAWSEVTKGPFQTLELSCGHFIPQSLIKNITDLVKLKIQQVKKL